LTNNLWGLLSTFWVRHVGCVTDAVSKEDFNVEKMYSDCY